MQIFGLIIATGAVVTLGYKFHTKVVMPALESLNGIWKSAKALVALGERLGPLADLVPVLKDMALEFKPNHGHSMKDYMVRIEDGLTHNRNLARVLLSSDERAYFETDGGGRCLWVNQAYMRLTGLAMDECLGFGWLNAIEINDRNVVAREWTISIQEGKTFVATYQFTKGFDTFAVKVRTVFSKDERGRVVGAIGTAVPASHGEVFAEEEVARGSAVS